MCSSHVKSFGTNFSDTRFYRQDCDAYSTVVLTEQKRSGQLGLHWARFGSVTLVYLGFDFVGALLGQTNFLSFVVVRLHLNSIYKNGMKN